MPSDDIFYIQNCLTKPNITIRDHRNEYNWSEVNSKKVKKRISDQKSQTTFLKEVHFLKNDVTKKNSKIFFS